ncbi:MAG TPA: hypothetical protein VJV78_27055 [Polyangiales bacterium]|nr:hypothetical protein [Polyangiales bacterium]
MIVNVFFLAAAGDSIVHSLKNLMRPALVALRPFFAWIGQLSR